MVDEHVLKQQRMMKKRKATSKVVLPHEIIEEILSRLEVKSLGRCRCVCKSWSELIWNPKFLNMHLNQSKRNKKNINVIIKPHRIYCYDGKVCNRKVVKTDNHVRSCNQVWGSCNGLVCISNIDGDVCLWNPSTQEYMRLPVIPNLESSQLLDFSEHDVFGLSYNSTANNYKVVCITCQSDSTCFSSQLAIYSLRTKNWKVIGELGLYLPSSHIAVVVNGYLHWVASKTVPHVDKAKVVIAFDTSSEKIVELPQQKDLTKGADFIYLDVAELGGKLCVMYNYAYRFDLWRMNEYGVRDTWSKIFTLKHPRVGIKLHPFKFHFVPLCFSDDEKSILIKSNKNLILYDIGAQRLSQQLMRDDDPADPKRFWKDTSYNKRFWQAVKYIESLVPLQDNK